MESPTRVLSPGHWLVLRALGVLLLVGAAISIPINLSDPEYRRYAVNIGVLSLAILLMVAAGGGLLGGALGLWMLLGGWQVAPWALGTGAVVAAGVTLWLSRAPEPS